MEYTEMTEEQHAQVLKSRIQGLEMDHASATLDLEMATDDEQKKFQEERIATIEKNHDRLVKKLKQLEQ